MAYAMTFKLTWRQKMTEKFANKIVFLSAVIAILGYSAHGFAQMGTGQHHYGGMHHGPAWHHQGYGSRGYDSWGNLSADETKQIEEERKAFFEATKEIRQQLYQKHLEIRSELAKKNPDAEMAAELQKEISALKAQMGQKRLDHILKLKKINPDVGRGLMGRGRMGYGMMGPKGYGGFSNCPHQGYESGYGMGPGMMGSGMMDPGMMGPQMMGPGRGRHMMPGGSARNYPPQYQQRKGPLEEKDAREVVENYLKSTRNPNLEIGNITEAGDVFEAEIVTKDNSLVDKVLVDKSSGWIRSAY
jgi:hypothetical protein